jgi:hypothetical protein
MSKGKKQAIPDDIKQQVEERVAAFNKQIIRHPQHFYASRYRGSYLYLDRYMYGRVGPICRLTYNGAIDQWGFAIYKYSDDRYDPGEWFFPGSEHIDGTLEGAMKGGLAAYP